MRYALKDLGHQPAGTTVTARLQGSACNVILMDEKNYRQYRTGQPFRYSGGHFLRSPVELEVPHDGHWYVVLDLGGYPGRVRGSVTTTPPQRAGGRTKARTTEVHA
jgi:uncharacterized protein DUF1883